MMSKRLRVRSSKDPDIEVAIRYCMTSTDQPFFTKEFIDDTIGYGVFASKEFEKNSFILEYPGETITCEAGEKKEEEYEKIGKGNFLFFYQHNKKHWCVDATNSTRFGAFVNDSLHGNCIIKKVQVSPSDVRLCLFASRFIPAGMELRYNYEDNNLWWRSQGEYKDPLTIQEVNARKNANKIKNPLVKPSDIMTVLSVSYEQDSGTLSQSLLSNDGGESTLDTSVLPLPNSVKFTKSTEVKLNESEAAGDVAEDMSEQEYKEETASGGIGDEKTVNTIEQEIRGNVEEIDGEEETKEEIEEVTEEEIVEEEGEDSCCKQRGEEETKNMVNSPMIETHKSAETVPEEASNHIDCDVIERNNESISGTISPFNVLHRIDKYDDDGFNYEKLSEEKMRQSDDFLWKLSTKVVIDFLEIVQSYLDNIRCGARRNWRHRVYTRESPVMLNGLRILRHHLVSLGLDTGDIHDDTNTSMTDYLLQNFNNDFDYVVKVLLPTAKYWMIICMCELSAPQARYYLANGGYHSAEIAYQKLRKPVLSKRKKAEDTRSTSSSSSSSDDDDDDGISASKVPANNIVSSKNCYENDNGTKVSSTVAKHIRIRGRKKCPTCGNEVTNLPRHMKLTHKWSNEKARAVNQLTNQRQNYMWHGVAPQRKKTINKQKSKTGKKKDYHRKKSCPVQGCSAVVIKLYVHLQRVHKMTPSSEYYELLSKARNYVPSETCAVDVTPDNSAENTVDFSTEEVADSTSIDCEMITDNTSEPHDSVFSENMNVNEISDEDFVRVTLAHFLNHLISPDGGQRDKKSSLQTINEVRCVITVLGGKLENLFDRYKIRDNFFRDYLDKKNKPGTAKHYLTSLISFMDFAVSEDLKVPGQNSDDYVKMRLRFFHWRRTYTKLVEEDKWVNEMEELEVLVTPEQCAAFEEGDYARKAVKIIGQAVEDSTFIPTILEFTNVRDYLFATIALANGHRSGVSANMTMAEYNSPSYDQQSEKWLIGVRKHKTFRTHGPAMVCLPNHNYNMLKTFVDIIRPHFAKENSENVFVSWRGKGLESGGVSKQINSIWKRSGVYGESKPPKKNISTTVIRKSVTTLVHDHDLDKAPAVADLLTHSLKTATAVYRLRNRQKQAVAGSKTISSVLKRPVNLDSQLGNQKWTNQEEDQLRCVFAEELSCNDISTAAVRKKYNELPHNRTVKQVLDKLKTLRQKQTTSLILPTENEEGFKDRVARLVGNYEEKEKSFNNDEELEEEEYLPDDDSAEIGSVIPPSSSFRRGAEKIFDSEETTLISNLCHSVVLSGPISIKRIVDAMEETEVGREMLSKVTAVQLQNKVKYLRRKLKET